MNATGKATSSTPPKNESSIKLREELTARDISAARTVRLARKEALIGRRELETGAVAFKVYVPGVERAGDVSFEVSDVVRSVFEYVASPIL